MTNPHPTHSPAPKICTGDNVLNTKDLDSTRTVRAGASVDCKLFQVDITVLDVCVNVHFTLVRREGSALESVSATAWRTR